MDGAVTAARDAIDTWSQTSRESGRWGLEVFLEVKTTAGWQPENWRRVRNAVACRAALFRTDTKAH